MDYVVAALPCHVAVSLLCATSNLTPVCSPHAAPSPARGLRRAQRHASPPSHASLPHSIEFCRDETSKSPSAPGLNKKRLKEMAEQNNHKVGIKKKDRVLMAKVGMKKKDNVAMKKKDNVAFKTPRQSKGKEQEDARRQAGGEERERPARSAASAARGEGSWRDWRDGGARGQGSCRDAPALRADEGDGGGSVGKVCLRERSSSLDYSILSGKWGSCHPACGQAGGGGAGGKGKGGGGGMRGGIRARHKKMPKAKVPKGAVHGEGNGDVSSGKAALALRAQVKSKLSRARYLLAMLQAYQQEGWGGRGHRLLKPTAELAKCEQQLAQVKRSLRELLQALDPDPRTSRLGKKEVRICEGAYDADGIDVDKVTCAVCASGSDEEPGNDILMCDFKHCNRAYHQKCHEPVLAELPHEDEDWFCAHCFCYADSVEAVNEYFGTNHISWRGARGAGRTGGGAGGWAGERRNVTGDSCMCQAYIDSWVWQACAVDWMKRVHDCVCMTACGV